jgi:hypothetical protein
VYDVYVGHVPVLNRATTLLHPNSKEKWLVLKRNPDIRGIEPLFLRPDVVCRLGGFGRGKLYQLVKAGKLRLVKEPGAGSPRATNSYITFESFKRYVESMGVSVPASLCSKIDIEELMND